MYDRRALMARLTEFSATRHYPTRDRDLAEAAANLFGYLRSLDDKGARGIAVMPVPDHGLGEAINDRLRRAAIGRS